MADNSGVPTAALELYLEFEDNLDDDSGNGRNQSPVLANPTFVTDGAVDKGARFTSRSGNYILTEVTGFGDADLFAGAGTPWSVACWIKAINGAAEGAIISRADSDADPSEVGTFTFTVSTKLGVIGLHIRGATTWYPINLKDEEWHHLAVTWDGTSAAFYIDNVAKTAPNVGFQAESATTNIIIGAINESSPVTILHAHLDSFRIYSKALSASEIGLLFAQGGGDSGSEGTVPENLELLLRFEDDLLDSSVNLRHQTSNIVNGPLTFVQGQVDSKASSWDADSDQHILTGVTGFGDANLFAGASTPFTVAAWFRYVSPAGGIGVIMNRYMDSAFGFRLNPQINQVTVGLRGSTTIYGESDTDDGNWHHVAVTWDGNDAAFYYDGTARSAPSVGSEAEGAHDITIGVAQTTGGGTLDLHFDGEMDDLRVYSRALTADEVGELADMEPNRFTATLTLTAVSDAVASLQIVFGDTPTSFDSGDVTTTNGTVSNVAGSGTTWTFDVTADADGVVTAQIAEDAVVNSAGIGNKASDLVEWGIGGVADPATGGILQFDRTASQSGQTANIIIGPVAISPNACERTMINKLKAIFGSGTSATGSLLVSVGLDGEDAVTRAENDAHQFSTTITSLINNNGVCFPRVAGHAAVFEIDVTSGTVILEQLDLELASAGRNSGARYAP